MVKYNYKNNGASKTSGLNNNNRIFETKDYTITVNNVFKEYVKFKPILVSRLLYEDTKQYVNTIKKIRKTY
jgi:hypothetical protein